MQRLSFTEGGNITPEDVEEWTEKLSHVLDISPGRHKIRIYLELMQLKSEQALLDFWEKCSTFLLKTKKQTKTQGWSQSSYS
jgi:S-ribosylhomocysteine lyase LuxS involved in autoinducer biosynthesis